MGQLALVREGDLMVVDVHAHCVPAALLRELSRRGDSHGVSVQADGGTRQVTVQGRSVGKLGSGLDDIARRLQWMDQRGIDVQVLSPWMTLDATVVDAGAAPAYARAYNEAIAGCVAEHPWRFAGLATLPLQDPQAAATELRHAVESLGMVGAEISCRPAGRELDDPVLDILWSTATELGCLLMLHPLDSLAGRGVERHLLGNTVGNPAESTIAVGHLIFGGVLERHPRLTVCVVHGGGFAPYQIGRWDHAYRHQVRGAAANLTRPPSDWLRAMYFDTVLHSPLALRLLVDVVGADHVMLGSDYPFEMGDADPLSFVASCPDLTVRQAQRITSDNLRSLVGLTRPADGPPSWPSQPPP